jgi:hypothetical protein
VSFQRFTIHELNLLKCYSFVVVLGHLVLILRIMKIKFYIADLYIYIARSFLHLFPSIVMANYKFNSQK